MSSQEPGFLSFYITSVACVHVTGVAGAHSFPRHEAAHGMDTSYRVSLPLVDVEIASSSWLLRIKPLCVFLCLSFGAHRHPFLLAVYPRTRDTDAPF